MITIARLTITLLLLNWVGNEANQSVLAAFVFLFLSQELNLYFIRNHLREGP